MTSMHLGGAERSLIGLLNVIDYSRYDVDLFLNRHEGELMEDIPSEVNMLPEDEKYKSLTEPMSDTIKRGQLVIALCRLIAKLAAQKKIGGKNRDGGITVDYSHKYTKWIMPRINPELEYDLAISYITPHYFVAEKIRAKKKIAWIHTDYSQIELDANSQMKMWSKYDQIVSISDMVSKQFVKLFPLLEPKLVRIENILPEKLIRRQAEEFIAALPESNYRLLSIGRFSYPKNFENIPAICAELVAMGLDVSWSIIGYGGDEAMIRESIKANEMENRVKILGKQSNPYPYIKICDLYVQPSRYEGKCVAVREAQMLGKPVVITDFPTATCQLEDGVDGVIAPLDNKGCAEVIAALLLDSKKMRKLADTCKSREYSNKNEIIKFEHLLN